MPPGRPPRLRESTCSSPIGSDATFGDGLENPLRDAWPQKLYHEAFARSAVLVNAADRAVRVGRALAVQVPLALEVHATVVAVWLGDTDLEAGFPVPDFEANLDLLVKRLSDSGARVLLGNISRARAGAAAYDDAIARIARPRRRDARRRGRRALGDPRDRAQLPRRPRDEREDRESLRGGVRSLVTRPAGEPVG